MLLRLHLLGPIAFYDENSQLRSKLSRKTQALLGYLAASRQPASRQQLAALFCQEADDPPAALRWHLSRIRRQLSPQILLTEDDAVRFNRDAAYVDAVEFAQVVGEHPAEQATEALRVAVESYRGEFLAGLSLPDAPEFELWLLGERARLHQLYEQALTALVERLIALEDYAMAIRWAQQLVQTNPLLEEAHSRLIWLYARTGQRQAALSQYEQCRALLQAELAVEPAPELVTLHTKVEAGTVGPVQRPFRPPETEAELPRSADFVGRQPELAELNRAWQQACRGRGTTILIEAEAGGGKTHIVQEFCRALSGNLVLESQCYESSQALPYRPWIDLLEARLLGLDDATVRELPPFWLNQLVRLLPSLSQRLDKSRAEFPPARSGDQAYLFQAVVEFLLRLPGTPPLLLFVDNLQWADEASLQLFHFAARQIPRSNALLIGAFRAEELDENAALQTLLRDLQRNPLAHLRLPPFTLELILDLMAKLWPELPPGYRTHIGSMLMQATGGNPLFTTEILRELAHSPHAPAELPIPDSVRVLIGRRLAKLSSSDRQVIEALAVLGTPATLAAAQQTSGRSQDEVVNAIDLGLRRGLMIAQMAGGSICYDFSHDLVREAVVDQLTAVRRQVLHRRAAVTQEHAGAAAAILAHHWALAGDGEKEGRYAALAGAEAAAIYANEEAIRYFERALALVTDDTQRIALTVKLGEVLHLIGEWTRAESAYRSALALAEAVDARSLQALCQARLGHVLVYRGAYPEALTTLTQARTVCEATQDRQVLGQIVGEMGIAYWYQGDYTNALSHLEQRLQIAREMADQHGASTAIANMGIVYWSQGDYRRALDCYEQKLQLDTEIDDRLSMSKALGNIGIVHKDLGNYEVAMSRLRQKLQIDEELGDQLGVSIALENIGDVYQLQGEYTRGLHCNERCLQIAIRLGHWPGVSVALGCMAKIHLAQREESLIERLAGQAIALGRHLNIPRNLCDYLSTKAHLHLRQQRYAEAQTLNDEALALAARVKQEKIQFLATIMAIRLRSARHHIAVPQAIDELAQLLATWTTESQQARLYFEMWRLDPALYEARTQAAELYAELHAVTPNIEYRRHYQELTGQTLAPPPPLPELPETVLHVSVDLPALLAQVDQAIADLRTEDG